MIMRHIFSIQQPYNLRVTELSVEIHSAWSSTMKASCVGTPVMTMMMIMMMIMIMIFSLDRAYTNWSISPSSSECQRRTFQPSVFTRESSYCFQRVL